MLLHELLELLGVLQDLFDGLFILPDGVARHGNLEVHASSGHHREHFSESLRGDRRLEVVRLDRVLIREEALADWVRVGHLASVNECYLSVAPAD